MFWLYGVEGLPKPTWLKAVIGTIATTLVVRRPGRLHSTDRVRVGHALRQMIQTTILK